MSKTCPAGYCRRVILGSREVRVSSERVAKRGMACKRMARLDISKSFEKESGLLLRIGDRLPGSKIIVYTC
jgi:hypothetical protein